MTILESETRFAFDFASGDERYDDVNLMGRRVMDVSQFGITGRIRVIIHLWCSTGVVSLAL